MPACAISPSDRRQQVRRVGNDLLKHHGRKRNYTVQEVQEANRRQGVAVDVGCRSHAAFNSRKDFDAYHESIGESCDFVSMKTEMLASVSTSAATSAAESLLGFDIDLSWLEFPDIDLSLFDFLS